ncbi:protein of unknown function [Burkholderia multivorans]
MQGMCQLRGNRRRRVPALAERRRARRGVRRAWSVAVQYRGYRGARLCIPVAVPTLGIRLAHLRCRRAAPPRRPFVPRSPP